MTRKRERAFALTMALLFLVTSVGLSIAVIWQLVTQNNGNQANNATTPQTSQASGKSKLQGTKLSGFTPVSKVAKLQAADIKVGSGALVKPGAKVTVNYTGAVAATGVIFQSSLDFGQPVPLELNKVIKGWQEGIPGMKVGGTRRLLIPAALGYGASPPPSSGIPANAGLVFDVTVTKIDK